MKVHEIMTQPVVTVARDTTLAEVAQVLIERRIGSVLVVDDQGRLCGIITDSDFAAKERGVPFSLLRLPQVFGQWMPPRGIERAYEAARTLTAREIFSPEVITATEDEPVEMVVQRMLHHDIHHIPVVRDEVPVGMVARHDLLKMIVRHARHE